MTDSQLNNALNDLNSELNNTKGERANTLRKRLDMFINGDPDNDDWNGLHEEMLEAEAYFIETNPRLASVLRSAVAVLESAGL